MPAQGQFTLSYRLLPRCDARGAAGRRENITTRARIADRVVKPKSRRNGAINWLVGAKRPESPTDRHRLRPQPARAGRGGRVPGVPDAAPAPAWRIRRPDPEPAFPLPADPVGAEPDKAATGRGLPAAAL